MISRFVVRSVQPVDVAHAVRALIVRCSSKREVSMAAAKKSKKKSSKKSDVKESALKSDAKDRKKDKKKSADSKVRPSGRPDAKKNAKPDAKKAEKSTGKGKTAAKSKPDGKAKPAAADTSEPTRSVVNGSSTKTGATASSDESAPTASPAKAGRAPSGPAPSPRPAVRRSGLKTSTPAGAEVPSTVQRSDAHAQATWSAAHDSAVEQYGEGERAHRTAFAALKHTYEKVGDHWEAKAEAGPSDSRAASPGRDEGTPAGGVDATASRAHLYRLAQRLDIPGRSTMTKDELVRALQKANDKATAEARSS